MPTLKLALCHLLQICGIHRQQLSVCTQNQLRLDILSPASGMLLEPCMRSCQLFACECTHSMQTSGLTHSKITHLYYQPARTSGPFSHGTVTSHMLWRYQPAKLLLGSADAGCSLPCSCTWPCTRQSHTPEQPASWAFGHSHAATITL